MSLRYYVGNGAAWNAAGVWSTASGGTGNASTPTAADDVIFDALSPGDCTITAAAVCGSLTATNYTHVLTLNFTILTIGNASAGAAAFPTTGTFNNSVGGTVVFASTSSNSGAGWNLTQPNTTSLGNLTFNGVGGRWKATTSLNAGNVSVANGTLDLNSQTSAMTQLTSATGTSTISFGTAVVTVSGNVDLSVGTATVAVVAGAKLVLSGASPICNLVAGNGSLDLSLTSSTTTGTAAVTAGALRDITITRGAGSTVNFATPPSVATYRSLTASASNTTINFTLGYSYRFTGTTPFTLSGVDATHTLTLHGTVAATNVTATTGAASSGALGSGNALLGVIRLAALSVSSAPIVVTFTYATISNIDVTTHSGAGNTYTAGSSINAGGNVGIVFNDVATVTDREGLSDVVPPPVLTIGGGTTTRVNTDPEGLTDQAIQTFTPGGPGQNYTRTVTDPEGLVDGGTVSKGQGDNLGLADSVSYTKNTGTTTATIVNPITYVTYAGLQTASIPTVTPPPPPGITVLTAETYTQAWVLADPVLNRTYTFPINPKAGGTPTVQRNLSVVKTTAVDGAPVTYQGEEKLPTVQVTGVLHTLAHYRQLAQFASVNYPVLLTDDFGRSMEILITDFIPKREASRGAVYRMSYTLNYTLIKMSAEHSSGVGYSLARGTDKTGQVLPNGTWAQLETVGKERSYALVSIL